MQNTQAKPEMQSWCCK